MEKMKQFISKITVAFFAIVGLGFTANAQCPTGEVEVFIDVATDTWGYELYWELVPTGQACGGTTVFTGGNPTVGCAGGGLQIATGADPGAYGSSMTTTEGPFCLTIGQDYDIIAIDDWGDGGSSFISTSQALNFAMPSGSSSATETFTAIAPVDHNLAIGNTITGPNGWDLNHVRPLHDKYYPLDQLTGAECGMGVVVSNYGMQNATNVYTRLNIDLMTGPGTYSNVFTDTLQFGTVEPDSNAFGFKAIDSSWYALGDYRYQYIIYQDSLDAKPSSDTITDYFSITSDLWSRVPMLGGSPLGSSAYFPGTSAFVDAYEWGSFYYMPNGAGMELDTFKLLVGHSSTATATTANYQLRVYTVELQGAQLDMSTDKTLVAIGLDTLTVTPSTFQYSTITNLLDGAIGGPFSFSDNKLYFFGIHQESTTAPYLSDGTTLNGLLPYGEPLNNDFSVYGNTNGYPFYSNIMISENFTPAYYTGWTSGGVPSMSFSLKGLGTTTNDIESNEIENVKVMPNPTSNEFTVSYILENVSDVQYIMTDLSGRLVHIEKSFDVTNESKTFDISKLPSGVYLLNIVSNNGSSVKRIIKK
jgi:hypothetical protein